MAARENEIGRCRCPVCASTSARLRVSARQLAYVTCDSCNTQVFARSERSDEKLRALHLPEAAAAPAEPPPAAPPTPAQANTAGEQAAKQAATTNNPPPAPKRPAWGFASLAK